MCREEPIDLPHVMLVCLNEDKPHMDLVKREAA
jgi:hypothetical protein